MFHGTKKAVIFRPPAPEVFGKKNEGLIFRWNFFFELQHQVRLNIFLLTLVTTCVSSPRHCQSLCLGIKWAFRPPIPFTFYVTQWHGLFQEAQLIDG